MHRYRALVAFAGLGAVAVTAFFVVISNAHPAAFGTFLFALIIYVILALKLPL
jgi:hypothetical protein